MQILTAYAVLRPCEVTHGVSVFPFGESVNLAIYFQMALSIFASAK